MKVVLLDIDGVLNYRTCKARCPNCSALIGIEDSRVERLAKIVKTTNAQIILTSTWKLNWTNEEDEHGIYLDRKLAKYGLHILDTTEDDGWNRWSGIKEYLDKHSNIYISDNKYRDSVKKYNEMEIK